MRSGRGCQQGFGRHRAPRLMQLGGLLPPSSVLSSRPFVWIMTQPLARHYKHVLADRLINSRSISTATMHCVVCSQIETTRGPSCQDCSRSLWLWPTEVLFNEVYSDCCCNEGHSCSSFENVENIKWDAGDLGLCVSKQSVCSSALYVKKDQQQVCLIIHKHTHTHT